MFLSFFEKQGFLKELHFHFRYNELKITNIYLSFSPTSLSMRRILWVSFLIILGVIVCGCTQPEATPAPLPIITPLPTSPPVTPSVPAAQKQINLSVFRATSEVNVLYNGGPDAADLTALNIRIDNQDGQIVTRTINYPAIGNYTFLYRGVANPAVVNIVGVFQDGTQQTVLMAYF
jgi:hypothetical protein